MSQTGVLLDKAGIFKAKIFDWSIQPSKETKSVAVCLGMMIDSEYDPESKEWLSWGDFEPHYTRGYYYVIGRDGKVNQNAVDQLVKAHVWDGNFESVKGEPPDVVVQVNVKEEEYKGEKKYKAGWLNPEDYVPEFSGASDGDVKKLQTTYGSLLRAAAGAAKKAAKAPAAKGGATATAAPPKSRVRPDSEERVNPISGEPLDDIPFGK